MRLGWIAGLVLFVAGAGWAATVREPAYGLPHFWAETDVELARENGREIAKDRLGQMILLARVDGEGVIVLIDRAKHDRDIASPADPSLWVFRRAIGDLVLYEVSPRPQAALLDRFRIPGAE